MDAPENEYRIVYLDFARLKIKLASMSPLQRERLWQAFAADIDELGPRITETKKATRLNADLIEYRHRAHPDVLVRLFSPSGVPTW
jgi:hypothetical protein